VKIISVFDAALAPLSSIAAAPVSQVPTRQRQNSHSANFTFVAAGTFCAASARLLLIRSESIWPQRATEATKPQQQQSAAGALVIRCRVATGDNGQSKIADGASGFGADQRPKTTHAQ